MKLESIEIEEVIEKAKKLMGEEKNLSPSFKATIEILLVLISLLANRMNLNSRNSSKPPSFDPNRERKKKKPGTRKPGGQKGHNGTTLKKVAKPDKIKELEIESSELPDGPYKAVGYESRQVIDLDISRVVTEYRAQVIEDSEGRKYTAKFPEGVKRPVQYGVNVKVHSVYMSQYQLIPYNRIEETFQDQVDIPLSGGSIYNFNQEAYDLLETFEAMIKKKLIFSGVCHVDETGINVNGKRLWLHSASNTNWTYYYPHAKRGNEAMEEMGIIPNFSGVLCHDHWKPYFRYNCVHALCNAHHLRELERAWEQDGQKWAKDMRSLLLEINKAVDDAGGSLPAKESAKYRSKYKYILGKAQVECPPPDENQRKGKRGRLKRSKARNLLERLINYEQETLLFMVNEGVPFSNNQGENDIRMTKVQQKIGVVLI